MRYTNSCLAEIDVALLQVGQDKTLLASRSKIVSTLEINMATVKFGLPSVQ